MKKLVKCEVCNQKIATHICPKCGSNVCDTDFNHETNLCKICSKGKVL